MRVVVDTNVWVSSLFGKRVRPLIPLARRGVIRVLTSTAQIEELKEVLSRPGLARYFPAGRGTQALADIIDLAVHVEPTEQIAELRDSDDDYLLELAVAGGAPVRMAQTGIAT
jgi:putative PIN family toxin of toxin-antitoxin system